MSATHLNLVGKDDFENQRMHFKFSRRLVNHIFHFRLSRY